MILGKKVHLQRLRLWCLYVSYRIACDVLISSVSFPVLELDAVRFREGDARDQVRIWMDAAFSG